MENNATALPPAGQNHPIRGLLAFILIAVFSLWLGLVLIREEVIFYVFIYLGYPNIFLTFTLFCLSLFLLLRNGQHLQNLLPRDWVSCAVTGVAFVLLLSFEPFKFKVIYDEPILSAVAQMMHADRLSGLPREANDFSGSYLLLNSFMDKRPLFFPFLLSLVHDVLGFRYQNVFFLNALLTGVLLMLVFSLGNLMGGKRGGRLAILLTLSLPLLATFTTSGHFEVLNLVMICLLLLLSWRYLEGPGPATLVPLVYCLLLLFHVRYENALYLLPFGLLILLGWKRANRIILPWQVLVAPLLLVIYVIQYRYILDGSRGFFQAGPNGREETFSLSYARENLESAASFFFSAGQNQPNSYLLTVFGISAVLFLLYCGASHWKSLARIGNKGAVLLFFLVAIGLYCVVITFFNFGLLDRYITHRLGLPVYLGFILLSVYAYSRAPKGYVLAALLGGMAAAAVTIGTHPEESFVPFIMQFAPVVLVSIAALLAALKLDRHRDTIVFAFIILTILVAVVPVTRVHRYSQRNRSNDMVMAQIQFLEEAGRNQRILWVSSSPYPALLTQTNYTTIQKFGAAPAVALSHLQDRTHDAIYVARIIKLEMGTREWVLFMEALDEIDEEVFKLEPVRVIPFEMGALLQIDRLVDVKIPE